MLVFEEIFKRGFMVMDRDKNVGTFNLPVVSGLAAKRKEKMLSFAWMVGTWRAVNTVRATSTTPGYEDTYEYTYEMEDDGARLIAVRTGGKKFPYLTFDAFSGRWMMTFTEVIYGVLQAKEWVQSQIVFTGPLTMLGVDCELRQTLTKKSENDFHVLNEERLPDNTWSMVDELMFTRI